LVKQGFAIAVVAAIRRKLATIAAVPDWWLRITLAFWYGMVATPRLPCHLNVPKQ
jgi:hypothetical protein